MAGRLRPELLVVLAACSTPVAAPGPAPGVPEVAVDGRDASDPEPAGDAADPDEAAPFELPARFETAGRVSVRRAPQARSKRTGLLEDCAIVTVTAWRGGGGCEAGWGGIDGGWVCLDHARPTDQLQPTEHPLIRFDPPTPEEMATYRRSGDWARDRSAAAPALLPFVYGRAAGRFGGRCWEDAASKAKGAPPDDRLDPERRYHFREVVETEDGSWLRKADGQLVPLDDVFLYAPSRFAGVDVPAERPTPEAGVAWVRRGGGNRRAEPSMQGDKLDQLEARTVVWTVQEQDGWHRLHRGGWIAGSRLRRFRPLPAPADAAGVWVDVDRNQQVLALREGEELLYATLVSTGVPPHDATPLGVFRVYDKMIHWDMASRAGDEDPYHLEEVPWVMHFWPRYALHGAFWHDGFGSPRSHGCINLAPRDAQVVFERIAPAVPPGWHTAWESPDRPGALLRVREDAADVPDRRRPLR